MRHTQRKDKMSKNTTEKIHALYCKSAVKNDEAIERRKKKLLDYANKKGRKNYEFYIDNGFSGATLERPDMKRLMGNIEKGLVASVTTTDISNLSRSVAGLLTLEKYFADHDVEYTNLEKQEDESSSITAIDAGINALIFDAWSKRICEACHQQMQPNNGCSVSHITIDGKKCRRIKAGDEHHAANADTTDDVTCPECNVGMGQYHHWECGVEECPVCRGYLQHCDCEYVLRGSPMARKPID
jgi:hypothetical protein